MEMTNILLFVSVSLILVLSPGPNTIYVVTKGITEGRKAAFRALLGASTGDMFQVLAASLGLAVLLRASYLAFFLIKMLGAGYLFYVGIRCLFNRQKLFEEQDETKTKGKNLFFTGFFTSALNPKTTLFFLSFLPQFIDNNSVHAQQQILLLGSVFVIMGFLVLNGYAFVSVRLRSWMAGNEKIQAYFNWVTGLVFIGFGLRVAFSERN